MNPDPNEAAGRLILPEIPLADWRESRDTVHRYARLAGSLRAELTPRQKHWWHVTLHAAAAGLTTTPIPTGDRTLELMLDLTRHRMLISTSAGEREALPLEGQSVAGVYRDLLERLAELDIYPRFDGGPFAVDTPATYDAAAVMRYWRALAWIDGVFKQFRGELREETGPVQVFPHHFDLSMNWFSGRLVPDADPSDEESADEQMNFGFLSGDDGISEAYFYVTAYPQPEGLTDTALPEGAFWFTEGFAGAVMMYQTVREAPDPRATLLNFLRAVHRAGSQRMG
ncbi:MAG: DUF5996 family protein [Pseudomonadota bacterium]|nr:DUF5996 family protein [Pseudomonadota bacterium]